MAISWDQSKQPTMKKKLKVKAAREYSPLLWNMVLHALTNELNRYNKPCRWYCCVDKEKFSNFLGDLMNGALRIITNWCREGR